MFNQPDTTPDEKSSLWQRIKIPLIGSVVVIVFGFVLANTFTYFQYGSTIVGSWLGSEQKKSPDAGKLAFAKGTKDYMGIIRGEGQSPRRGKVYYIEQAGGVMIEVAKELIEVREPKKE
jgi:hypothetical protein